VNPRQTRANIGIVPQELNFDPFFSPKKLLDLQAGLYGVPAGERKSDALLSMVGLADKADAYTRSLSGRDAAAIDGGKSHGTFPAHPCIR
jgi:ABC-2 type transport system ATP-binding protein